MEHPAWLGRTWARIAVVMLLLMAVLPCARADSVALRGSWLPAVPGAGTEDIARIRSAQPLRPFDAARLVTFGQQNGDFWVRLEPANGHWPQEPLVVVVHAPPFVSATMILPDGSESASKSTGEVREKAWHGHGRLAFPVLQPPTTGPIVLRLRPDYPLFAPLRFAVQPLAEYQTRDAQWLTFASACFATMLLMALIAFFFALRLSDRSFYYYSGYIVSYALLQGIQSGFVFQPLRFGFINEDLLAWYRLAVGGAVVLPALFLDAFANLRYYFPLGHRTVLGFGFAAAATTLIGFLPWPAATVISHHLFNPVLVLGLLNMLTCTIIALCRGSRYAGFFLLGWTPLLVVAALASSQMYGQLAGWVWVDNARIAVGAYEAIVLSLGLIDRTLLVRRERDQARRLAELDPLTNLLNRRAWLASVQALLENNLESKHSLSVMFIDLDHFKSLNDHYGHAAGDEALVRTSETLRRTLRPVDLLSRYGGEEFVAALPQCSLEGAQHIAERVLSGIAALHRPVNRNGDLLTASIGIATAAPGERMESLLARADQAMYAAKTGGRNQVAVAESPADSEWSLLPAQVE